MPIIEFDGIIFKVDECGHLVDFDQWCDQWLQLMIQKGEVEKITDECMRMFLWMRDYYSNKKAVSNIVATQIALNCPMRMLYSFFPNGFNGLCKTAGLPKPVEY